MAAKHHLLLLLVVVAGLTAIRLPSAWYRMGGQDEQWYTVPGWTVANEGIPRIPYVPVDDPGSVFQGAYRILYALPPAYFYLQAPFFWLFEPGYGTARLASVLAGACALMLLYAIMRLLGVRPWLALICLPVCAQARAFYFPWQDSRPDLLCAMFGLAAMWLALMAKRGGKRKLAILSGLLVGLGALSHPYAIVFAIQVGGIYLLSSNPWRQRLQACLLAGLATLCCIALWLPLIALDVPLFWLQFSSNVLSRSGPGLLSRLIWPWPFVPEQIRLINERLGTYQVLILLGVCAVGLLIALWPLWMRCVNWTKAEVRAGNWANPEQSNAPYRSVLTAMILTVSSLYIHVASLGTHPAQGYLCYPWALLVLLLACLLEMLASQPDQPGWRGLCVGVCMLVTLLLLIPGSGLRATWTYALRNDETNYNRQEFCRQLNQRFPVGAKLLVSPEFVFEFELLGRKPINASRLALYHDVRGQPFDYLIASTQAIDEGLPEYLHAKFAWEFGNAEDELACHVKVYVPTATTPVTAPWPRP